MNSPELDTTTLSLETFLPTIQSAITSLTTTRLQPQVQPHHLDSARPALTALGRTLYPPQMHAATALHVTLQTHRAAILQGEMATGKTTISIAAAHLAQAHRVLVLAAPHLLKKWQREIKTILPHATALILRRLPDLHTYFQTPAAPHQPVFGILSREYAKLSYRKRASLVPRLRPIDGNRVTVWTCPDCGAIPLDPDGHPHHPSTLQSSATCSHCHTPLMTTDPHGPRRYPLSLYLKKYHARAIDLLITDEIQEYKAKASAQSIAFQALVAACRKVMVLTGTLTNGRSTSIFWILYHLFPTIRQAFGYHQESQWVDRFGTWEMNHIISNAPTDAPLSYGIHSKRREFRTVRERPGLSPELIPLILNHTVFLKLHDLGASLPPYQETIINCDLTEPLTSEYRHVTRTAQDLLRQAKRNKDGHLLTSTIQALLRFPDHAWREETLTNRKGEIEAVLPTIPSHVITPKEETLLARLKANRDQGLRTLVYAHFTQTKSIFPHLQQRCQDAGLATLILPATVPPEQRESWILAHQNDTDVLFCNPKLVQTGLDLLAFPEIIFYEPEYSIYVFRQAARRSWRLGQHAPVNVTILSYDQTAQAQAWSLIAKGIKQSLLLEGELPSSGITENIDHSSQDTLTALINNMLEISPQIQSAEQLFQDIAKLEHREDPGFTPPAPPAFLPSLQPAQRQLCLFG